MGRTLRRRGAPWLRLPGVYRPQADTWLLGEVLGEAPFPPGARVLDLCTGCGVLAAAAARAGAGEVAAVDASRRAVLSATLNTRMRRLPVRTCRGDALELFRWSGFDAIVANPPYMPRAEHGSGAELAGMCWDAGPDGRHFLDALGARAPELLNERGTLLVVQSELSDADETLRQMTRAGLKASIVARTIEPFGPIARARAGYLERIGVIEPGRRYEELVVIRADRAEQTDHVSV